MLALGHPVSDASTHRGRVVASVSHLTADQLPALRRAAGTAATRIEHSCRCTVRGYEVRARVPGRGVLVVASGP
jgi:hypothetical protein